MPSEHSYAIYYSGTHIPVTAETAKTIADATNTALAAGKCAQVNVSGDDGSVLMTIGPGIPLLIVGPPLVDLLDDSSDGR